jgi:hypothetical protein
MGAWRWERKEEQNPPVASTSGARPLAIPAKARRKPESSEDRAEPWTPACAGVTTRDVREPRPAPG